MANTSASAQAPIVVLLKSGTYSTYINCSMGDLFQFYESTASAAMTPDFASLQPTLTLVVTSSRSLETVTLTELSLWVNGTKVDFSGGTSTGKYAGIFQQVSGANPGFRIVKNLAAAVDHTSASIVIKGNVTYNGEKEEVQAPIQFRVQQNTGSGQLVTVLPTSANGSVLDESHDKCELKCMVYKGDSLEDSTAFTYKWSKWVSGAWTDTGKTIQSITVNRSDVDSRATYKCEVYSGSAFVGSDTHEVLDKADPCFIVPNPSPADATIEIGNTSRSSVAFTPTMYRQSDTVTAVPATFSAVIMDGAGTKTKAVTPSTVNGKTVFTVTQTDVNEYGSALFLMITGNAN